MIVAGTKIYSSPHTQAYRKQQEHYEEELRKLMADFEALEAADRTRYDEEYSYYEADRQAGRYAERPRRVSRKREDEAIHALTEEMKRVIIEPRLFPQRIPAPVPPRGPPPRGPPPRGRGPPPRGRGPPPRGRGRGPPPRGRGPPPRGRGPPPRGLVGADSLILQGDVQQDQYIIALL